MRNTLNHFILLFAAFSFTASLQAQLKFQGRVLDSLQTPLESASLVAIDKQSNSLETFAITNAQGTFELKLRNNRTYKIQVSYIGLETAEEELSTTDQDIQKDYTLYPAFALDEVELVVKMPVAVRGDTLVYDADSFQNGSERKLEDIVEKLPGVEINEDGQIEVEGKVVNKLMVNGKDFFDGDTKVATKNIPSSAVDKIQILRNYAEVGQLSSVRNNQDNVAINVKLKEGKESFWFGDITGGGGSAPTESLYIGQPKLFYYNPKYSLNFIGDLNNIGEVALTRRDIRGFGGGFRRPSQRSGTNINLGDNSLNFLTNQSNAQRIENKLASANFSYAPSKNLDLSGFLIYNYSQINSQEISFVRYTNAELNIPDETTNQLGNERSKQGLLKLSASYKPNFNHQIDYDVLARNSNDSQQQLVNSSVIGSTDQIEEATPYSINQNLNYYFTLDENNIFALEAQHLLQDEDPFYNAVLENNPDDLEDAYDSTAAALGLSNANLFYDIGQSRRVKSNQLDAKLDYYHILSPRSNLNFTLGTIVSRQNFNSSLFEILNGGLTQLLTPNFNDGLSSNDVDYNFSDLYLALHWRFRTGKFTFTPGISVHSYSNSNTQLGVENTQKFTKLLPDFETRIQFKKGESLTLNYNLRAQFTDVTRIARAVVLNSYNAIQFGTPELQNALSHNMSLLYSSFNLFNYTNVFARAAYSNNTDQIRGLTSFDNVIRTSTFFNSNFADENFNLFGRIQKTFGKVRTSFNASWNYSKINQFIQDRQSLNKGFTQTYTPGIRTNFKVAPNISLRYRYSLIENDQGSRKTTFVRTAPSVNFDAYIKKKITLRSDYSYTTQKSEGNAQSFQNWNASMSYRKDRDAKWEYEVRASNILNIDAQIRNSANNLSVLSSETFIQPRFITVRLIYSL
jgi:hypothetical protein